MFEVTSSGEIVWEYRSPYSRPLGDVEKNAGVNYRAYAVPYEWVPQLTKPVETPVSSPSFPGSFIMLPDDKGNIPNFKPTVDKGPAMQFKDVWTVNRPAK